MAHKLILLSIFVLACVLSTQAGIQVTMHVFSGVEDPTWTLIGKDEIKARQYIQDVINNEVRYEAPYFQMGYTGFTLNGGLHVYGHQEFELFLLHTWPERVHYPSVMEHVQQVMAERVLIESANIRTKQINVKDKCDIPVVGADNITAYNPQTDCCGFFIKYQTANNCYDYGSDIVTNTFAQPGRGSGHRWDYDTCDSVKEAAERDGLVWFGTTLPTGNPSLGHYVSLHIWPNTNFHWLRKDTNIPTHWSHKPGGTQVRDVDNNGNKITDPSKADVSPWSQFCGYMIVVPSKVTIN